MDRNLLKQVITEQAILPMPTNLVARQIDSVIAPLLLGNSILIISGIRRCGKSTLLRNIRQQRSESDFYINFDDDRLVNFELVDFQMLYEVFVELFGKQQSFYFDEIQNIPEWERFVRRLHDEGNKVFITGSNAAMLSKELGTRLTGRYISVTLYPYSFYEFVSYKNINLLQSIQKDNYITSTVVTGQILALFAEYLQIGGIPEYVRYKQPEYINSLYENILYRDIIVRHKLTKQKELKQLVFYIASNIGKNITFSAIRKFLGLGNASTVSEYFGYLEDSYLCFLVNKYDPSLNKQMLAEKKQYIIDHGIARIVGFMISEDSGRFFENIVYLELLRRGYNVYVHRQDYECDFVLQHSNKIIFAIQVCKTLADPETKQREYKGLLEAMQTYKLTQGLILTENENLVETIAVDNKKYIINIVPLWKWLLDDRLEPKGR